MNLKDLLVKDGILVILINNQKTSPVLSELLDIPEDCIPVNPVAEYRIFTPAREKVLVVDNNTNVYRGGDYSDFLTEMGRRRTWVEKICHTPTRPTTVILQRWTGDDGNHTFFNLPVFLSTYTCVVDADTNTFRVIRRPNGEAVDNTAYPLSGVNK